MIKEIELNDVVAATGGQVLSKVDQKFKSVGTDTRANLEGQLFVALKGENFDAHSFLIQAAEKGAAGLLVHEVPESQREVLKKTTVIQVKDSLLGLQQLGRFRRRQLQTPLIAITGSNGKTTSKEFIAAILGKYKKVHFNKGSYNNHWGVPLTLLGLQPEHEIGISEMGMNHPGEITDLVKIAEPDVVVVTMVGRAHLEGLGSIEGVAAAKEEIYRAAKSEAIRIFNLDNPHTLKMFERAKSDSSLRGKLITFSSEKTEADVHFKLNDMDLHSMRISGSIQGQSGEVEVQVFGSQNLVNLMVAAAGALALGLTPQQIWQAMSECRSAWGRNQLINLQSGAKVIFDAYNANPDSQKALIENLNTLKGYKKIGVFGEMRELGSNSDELHKELGELVSRVDFDQVWFLGPHHKDFASGFSKGQGSKGKLITSEDFDEAIAKDLKSRLDSTCLISIKGSRGMRLERVLKTLAPLDFVEK